MTIWVEIHCDVLSDGPPDKSRIDPFCLTHRGDNHGALTLNTLNDACDEIRALRARAVENGWEYTSKRGWACPNCKTVTS